MTRQLDLGKQQLWLGRIQRWQRSQLTIGDFCARHHLSEANFYCWKRTLLQRGLLTDNGLPPRGAATPVNAPVFLPVTVSAADTSAGRIDLVLPDGWTVRVAAGFDVGTLRELLALLRERPC
jgi:hypothetical protein